MSLAAGTILAGRYRILTRLGEGGMGSVYQAEDLRLPGRMWAIKELLGDAHATPEDLAAAIKRFDDEIALMARLSNPRIPGVVDRFREGGHHYFAMDFIPGASLETRLAQVNAPLPERQVLAWIIQVCDVLAYIHAQHPPIILRDLKPGNIMVTPDGEVRVIDFGIARTYKRGQASNTENLGTMIYASPEHLGQSGQTDARSDVYSLGATLYHLLTNHEPVPMETPAPGGPRRLNPTVSEATERAVIRAMQVDPARRFQSAAEMATALRVCLAHLSASGSSGAGARGGGSAVAGVSGAPPSARSGAPRAGNPAAAKVAASSGAAPRLARVRGGVVCPQCGNLNRTGARYCARDGVLLPGAASATGTAAPRRAAAGAQPVARRIPAGPSGAAPLTAPVPAPSGATPIASGVRGAGVPTLPGIGTAELNALRGTEALAAGRYLQAARHLEMAVAQGRATYDTHLLLGRAYRQLGRASDAAAQFERAGRLRPTAEAYLQVGLAEREAGHPAEAQVALMRARQLDARDPLIAYQLGLACLEQGHLAQAEGELEAGLALQPEQASILLALGHIRATRHQWEEAIEFFRRASAAAPDNAGAYLDLGRALLALRRLNEATRALEEAVRLAPDSAEAQTALGMCYHAQGKRRQARSALRQAVTLDPNDGEARRLLKQL
jgi:tetratricopeptide (TPR) repeat protein